MSAAALDVQTIELSARAAYEASMNLRTDKRMPFEPWEKLSERWRIIFRTQARAALERYVAGSEPAEPSLPVRVQLSRRRGWRKPDNTVVVARPSSWGNPFRVGENALTRADAVAQFRELVMDKGRTYTTFRGKVRAELAGKNLACWCPPSEPCHADVLLEIANGTEQK